MTFFIHSSFIHSFSHSKYPSSWTSWGECQTFKRPSPVGLTFMPTQSGLLASGACSPGSPGHGLPWSLGHVHPHSDLRVTYPWGLCYMIPISRVVYFHTPISESQAPWPPDSHSTSNFRVTCSLCPSRDYIPRSVPVTRATPAYRSCTLHPSLRSRAPPLALGHMTSLSRPLHTGTCALEQLPQLPRVTSSPGLQSQGHMPPPPQPLLSVSGHKVKCPSTPHLWLTDSSSVMAQLWSKASPLLIPAC